MTDTKDTYASLAYQLDLSNDAAESVFLAALDIETITIPGLN